MTKRFSGDPFLSGWMAPFGTERDAPEFIVEGELPDDLVSLNTLGTMNFNGQIDGLVTRVPAGFHGSWVGAS